MKIVVTGASGFLGSHTVRALVDAGHSVVGLSRKLPSPARTILCANYIGGVDVVDSVSLKGSISKAWMLSYTRWALSRNVSQIRLFEKCTSLGPEMSSKKRRYCVGTEVCGT